MANNLIWIIIGLVVVLAIVAVVVAMTNRTKSEQRRAEAARDADRLRSQAAADQTSVQQSSLDAKQAELDAEQARMEAQRAELRAQQAQQGAAQDQAVYEDRIREADRLDPAVDHRAEDYRPEAQVPPPGQPESATDDTLPSTEPYEGTRRNDTVQGRLDDPASSDPGRHGGYGDTAEQPAWDDDTRPEPDQGTHRA